MFKLRTIAVLLRLELAQQPAPRINAQLAMFEHVAFHDCSAELIGICDLLTDLGSVGDVENFARPVFMTILDCPRVVFVKCGVIRAPIQNDRGCAGHPVMHAY